MPLLFTPCDILDVTGPQNKTVTACGSVWPLWVHVNCTLTISLDNVYLLVDDWTFASTNNKYLEDSRANRLDLQWNTAPALQWIGPSILLISSTIWCSFWLISAPLLSESNQETEQKTVLLDCCIPVRLRTSAVHQACEVRDQAPTHTDSDYVMEKPSRCWLGAVPRYWKVVASCFQIVSFAENTSVPLAPRARISQPILLPFFLFSCSWICLQNGVSDFFYSFSKFSGVQKTTGLA